MGAAVAQVTPLPEEDIWQDEASPWDEYESTRPGILAPVATALPAAPVVLTAPAGPGGSDRLAEIFAGDAVRSGEEIGAGSAVIADTDLLPVLPALRDLLPGGALRRGSVVAAGGWSLLCLALAAGPVASGAWCAVAGLPQLGVRAAADAGLDPGRLLLIPDLGPSWPQVVASLLDGCDLVLLCPPARP
jgi:hypothetical protein